MLNSGRKDPFENDTGETPDSAKEVGTHSRFRAHT